MRKTIAIVVAILVGASCIPWVRRQQFFSTIIAATALAIFLLMAYGIARWSLRRASETQKARPLVPRKRLRVILILVPVFLLFLLLVPHFVATSGGDYKLAVATAHKSPRLVEALGSPLKEGWFSEGKRETGDHAKSEMSIPIRGPKRAGSLRVFAIRDNGTWQLQELSLELTDPGEHIDLLSNRGGSDWRVAHP